MSYGSPQRGHLPPASNRADFLFGYELIDPITSDNPGFTSGLITVALRPVSATMPAVTGTSLDGHVIILGPSNFEVHFQLHEMQQFPAGDLDMGITFQRNGVTYQLFAGQVPIIDGVVA